MRRFGNLTILFGVIVAAIGLALFAYIGFYNRYWGDDWCYNRDFKNLGVWGTANSYFFTGEDAFRGYSTNRYGLTLLSGIFYMMGIFGTQILATVVVVLWLIGLFWVLSNISRLGLLNIPKHVALLGCAVLLYFTLYLSPQRFQVLYWQAGVHYSFALITGVYLLGLITYQMNFERRNKLIDLLIALIAFIGGGLSEIGCVYLIMGCGLLLVVIWRLKRKQIPWAVSAYPSVLIALIFLVLSMVALMVSPSNSRFSERTASFASLPTVPFLAFQFAFDFIYQSLKSMPVPHMILLLFFLCLSIVSGFLSSSQRIGKVQESFATIVAVVIVTFLLISAVQAPVVFTYNAPPDPRGQSLSRFTMLAGVAVIGWFFGQIVTTRWQKEWINVVALAGIVMSTVYTARFIKLNYAELPEYIHRAELWDQRDASIKAAKSQGQEIIEVIVIDMYGLGVQDIMRSRDMEKDRVVSCGSEYYGVQAIKAISP